MFILNRNGDTTIKHLIFNRLTEYRLTVVYKGVPCFCSTNLSKFKMSITAHMRYWKTFQLLTPLEWLFQNCK